MYKHLAPRCPARFDLSRSSAAPSPFSITLFLCLCPPLSFLPHLSLRIRSAAFPVPSAGTIDVSIPVGWCSLAFATVSACTKSAGVVCPAVLRLPRAHRLRPRSPPILLSLLLRHARLLVSKSMGRVLAVERARIHSDQSPRA